MPSHANLPTRYRSSWFPGDIMSYPFYDINSHETHRGELLLKILVYKFVHITYKGRMWVIMIAFSQPGVMGLQVYWATTVHDKEDGYKRPPFRWRSLLPPISSTIHRFIQNHELNWQYLYHDPFLTYNVDEQISTKDNQYGCTRCGVTSHQRPEDTFRASHNYAGNTLSRDTQSGPLPNQFLPPQPYSYLPSRPPFPGALKFNHPAPFNMTPSSQPSSAATEGCPTSGLLWERFNFPQCRYGGPQMFPPQQFIGQGISYPGAPWVPPAPPWNDPVIWRTSYASMAYGILSGASGRPPISLGTQRF
jgi:hypothetical protein